MITKTAIILAVLLIVLSLWTLSSCARTTVTVNGRVLTGPARVAISGLGMLISTVTLFFVAFLLAFVFAGVGLIVFGLLILVGLILIVVAFPLLLPLLIPLLIVLIIVAAVRKNKSSNSHPH